MQPTPQDHAARAALASATDGGGKESGNRWLKARIVEHAKDISVLGDAVKILQDSVAQLVAQFAAEQHSATASVPRITALEKAVQVVHDAANLAVVHEEEIDDIVKVNSKTMRKVREMREQIDMLQTTVAQLKAHQEAPQRAHERMMDHEVKMGRAPSNWRERR